MSAATVEGRLVRIGVLAGALAVVTYLAKTFLPLAASLERAFFLCRGPLVVVAFVGFYPFMMKGRPSASALLATVFGVIAGAATMLFGMIQVANLHEIGQLIGAADSAVSEQMWRAILRGVFTVQNGINIVADFFLDTAAFLLAIAMWSHPRFGRWWALFSVALVGPHFVMKAVTFPVPPAEAGLFDGGPLVSVWFALVIIQVGRSLGWMDARRVG